MRVEPVPLTLTLPPSKTPRSAGLHASNVIRYIAAKTGILRTELAEDVSLTDVRSITDPVAILRICIGLAWEEWLAQQLPDVLDHPGEMSLDGIYLTHDGESLDHIYTERGPALVPRVHEYKTTYKSLRSLQSSDGWNLESQWMWTTQLKCYCKALSTRHARLYALFLCGDYAPPIRPQFCVWDVEFTQEEIDENWDLITAVARQEGGL